MEITYKIKEHVDLVREILDVVPMQKKGKDYLGLCPFHTEKSPSFSVDPQKGFFYCFGCKASGDVIEFRKRFYNESHREACTRLAEKYSLGQTLPPPLTAKALAVPHAPEPEIPALALASSLPIEPEPAALPLAPSADTRFRHVYEKSTSEPADQILMMRYFHGRDIPLDAAMLFALGIRISRWHGKISLVIPVHDATGQLVQVRFTEITEQGQKISKSSLGSSKNVPAAATIIGEPTSPVRYICEGLEDGLTIYYEHLLKEKARAGVEPKPCCVFVANGHTNFERLKPFFELKGGARPVLILDLDSEQQSLISSLALDSLVDRRLPTLEIKLDANSAKRQGRFPQWWASLKSISLEEARGIEKQMALQRQDRLPPGFELDEQGLMHEERIEGSNETKWVKIGARLVVDAETVDIDGNFGVLVSFYDRHGQRVQMNVMRQELVKQQLTFLERMSGRGYTFSFARGSKYLIAQYLAQCHVRRKIRQVRRIGWYDRQFVLPTEVFGEGKTEFFVECDHNKFKVSGTLKGWQKKISKPLEGNPKLIFALSQAFAGTLLAPFKLEGCGFHYHSVSSQGKSTTMDVAGSVCGGGAGGYRESWKTTGNALESIASAHNHTLLCLDEIGEVNPDEIGSIVYMLGNGQGKGRKTKDLQSRERERWLLCFMSNGEGPLAEYIAAGQIKGGHEVRFIDIDVSGPHGVFDQVPGAATPSPSSCKRFAEDLKHHAQEEYGTALRAYLNHLVKEDFPALKEHFVAYQTDLHDHLPSSATGPVARVFSKFCLVGFAGELAIQYDILPYDPGTCTASAMKLFEAWVDARGGHQALDETRGVQTVQDYILKNQHRFIELGSKGGLREVVQPVGYRQVEGLGDFSRTTFMLFPESFREACKGYSHKRIAGHLYQKGWLEVSKSRLESKGSFEKLVRIPGGVTAWLYVLSPRFFEEANQEER